MKKIIAITLIALLLLGVAGCGAPADDGKAHVICTVFPQYDWVRNIIGSDSNVKVSLLMDSGADLHNYQTNANDLYAISTCDLFIYIGGDSDEWVKKAVEQFGFVGIFTGGLSAAAAGIGAAIIFGYIMSLVFKPGDRN